MAVMAEYFCGRDHVHLFLADADDAEPQVVTFPLEPVLEQTPAYLSHLLGAPSEPGSALCALLEPIVEKAREDELVWVIPHGILHYLPFHAVPTSEGVLGFRNPLCYTPSASVLPICRRGPRLRGQTVVTLGDPTGDLPYARREAGWVAAAFNVDPMLGHGATKGALFSALKRHDAIDIVHFACHGHAGAEDAYQSGVLLAPGQPSASRADLLSAGEILRHRLRAALVTVSACDAGLGTVASSDEELGLTRALLYAGVSSVLLSSWPLDDLSTYLMVVRFYQELQQMIDSGHGSKASALRAAQLFIHDMTVREVVTQCDESAARCKARGDIVGAIDFADEAAAWAEKAGDFEGALQRLHVVRATLEQRPDGAARRESVRNRIEELEFRSMLRRPPVTYDARPYADETYWAGFFLHGDWAL